MFENFSKNVKKNVDKVVGAGVIAAAGIVGAPQNAEAGGYMLPSHEEMSQINATLTNLESQYKSKYGGDIQLVHMGNSIRIRDRITQKSLGEIQTRNIFSKKSELDIIKSIPVFEIAKEKIVGTLDFSERGNLNFEVKSASGEDPTSFEISKYGYATLKVSGASLNSKNGQLYSSDGVSRIDFTDGGKNIEVKISGNISEMAITACVSEKATGGGVLQKAFKISLEGNYPFSEFSASEVIKKCK